MPCARMGESDVSCEAFEQNHVEVKALISTYSFPPFQSPESLNQPHPHFHTFPQLYPTWRCRTGTSPTTIRFARNQGPTDVPLNRHFLLEEPLPLRQDLVVREELGDEGLRNNRDELWESGAKGAFLWTTNATSSHCSHYSHLPNRYVQRRERKMSFAVSGAIGILKTPSVSFLMLPRYTAGTDHPRRITNRFGWFASASVFTGNPTEAVCISFSKL